MRRLAVYGTLRQNGRLHSWVAGAKPVGTQVIEGFKMYNVSGWYPAITKDTGKILVEVYELPNEVAKDIADMEQRAGYKLAKVQTEYGEAEVFYQDREMDNYPVVESGDWIEHVSKGIEVYKY